MVAAFLVGYVTVFAVHAPPVRTMEIPAATAAIAIDGTDDAGYSAIQSTDAFVATGSTGADADFTLTFKVAYDPQYLYVWTKVLDDYDNSVSNTKTANPYEYDCWELFLDLDTVGSGANPTYDTNTIQLRFNRGLTDSVQQAGRAAQQEYKYYFANTADGYIHEVAIPWTVVLGDGQMKQDMMDYLAVPSGFDLSGADSDTDGAGARDCQTAWDSDDPADVNNEDNAWNTRNVFGVITLAANNWDDFVFTTGVETPSVEAVSAYPNPADNTITFGIEGLNTVEIYSITGVQVMHVETTGTVDISSLNSGIYVAKFANGATSKFMVK
jgi:hypothetical protein